MKMLNFPDNTTIFLLRGINCHTRIQAVLKSHQKASSSKTKNKNRTGNQDKWYGHYCTLKYLERILLTLFLITATGDIIDNK